MIALTLRQPYAWAVLRAGKDIENRSSRFKVRGRILIHSGQQYAPGTADAQVAQAAGRTVPLMGGPAADPATAFGSILGSVELYDAHHDCDGSCSPWAQPGAIHLQLRDPIVLRRPVPCPGRLGTWTPDESVLDVVKELWPR